MYVGRVFLFLLGLLLVIVGIMMSWRLIIELIGLLLVLVGLFIAASALLRGRS